MTHTTAKYLSIWDLRRNLPAIRSGLKRGARYILLFRGKPVGELIPPSKETLDQVFSAMPKKRPGAVRIRRKVARRRRQRKQKQ